MNIEKIYETAKGLKGALFYVIPFVKESTSVGGFGYENARVTSELVVLNPDYSKWVMELLREVSSSGKDVLELNKDLTSTVKALRLEISDKIYEADEERAKEIALSEFSNEELMTELSIRIS